MGSEALCAAPAIINPLGEMRKPLVCVSVERFIYPFGILLEQKIALHFCTAPPCLLHSLQNTGTNLFINLCNDSTLTVHSIYYFSSKTTLQWYFLTFMPWRLVLVQRWKDEKRKEGRRRVQEERKREKKGIIRKKAFHSHKPLQNNSPTANKNIAWIAVLEFCLL